MPSCQHSHYQFTMISPQYYCESWFNTSVQEQTVCSKYVSTDSRCVSILTRFSTIVIITSSLMNAEMVRTAWTQLKPSYIMSYRCYSCLCNKATRLNALRASKAARFRALRCAVLPWRPGARAHVKQISAIDESASPGTLVKSRWCDDSRGADLKSRRFGDSERSRGNGFQPSTVSYTDKAIQCWIKLLSTNTHTHKYVNTNIIFREAYLYQV